MLLRNWARYIRYARRKLAWLTTYTYCSVKRVKKSRVGVEQTDGQTDRTGTLLRRLAGSSVRERAGTIFLGEYVWKVRKGGWGGEERGGGGPRQRAVNYNSTARSRTESPNLRARLVKILSRVRGRHPSSHRTPCGTGTASPLPATSDLITAHQASTRICLAETILRVSSRINYDICIIGEWKKNGFLFVSSFNSWE